MSKFGPPAFQSAQVMKVLQVIRDDKGNKIFPSQGTIRNYESSLCTLAAYMDENRLGSLEDATVNQVNDCLIIQAQDYSQSSVDMLRQASQAMLQYKTNKLSPGDDLPRVFSENPTIMAGRSYALEQSDKIMEHQYKENALATETARECGARAHEILTILPAAERPADERPISEHKFKGLEGVRYTVTGKGGLTREVMISKDLSDRLEKTMLDTPRSVIDRGIKYTQHYNISGGQRFSNSFSQASNRALGFSNGAHGLRHSYAQERLNTLQCLGLSRKEAVEAVSQELGHFRLSIVEVYLR